MVLKSLIRRFSSSPSSFIKPATGNEKSNKFWEAELPPNFDRSRIEKFIRTKYEEKRWAPKGETKLAAKTTETNHNIDKFPEGVKGCVSRKPRALSLEDEIFTKHISNKSSSNEVPKGVCILKTIFPMQRLADLNMVIASPLLPPPLIELNTPTRKTNGASEFYNALPFWFLEINNEGETALDFVFGLTIQDNLFTRS
ncbi:uncharacterized protein LOC116140984 [Pistacia vera]|uniref:uncharacterized protein LOC116140984 n=1 Tax=Pistacia vera TaxID=55513 RepID=UPI0012630F07|nr:uncharacterized protein LOC116140984 [Pistacia vera]